MTSLFMAYLMVTGAMANGIKVLRHVGKAAARASEGEYRESGNELLTAAVAPLDGVIFQSSLLGCAVEPTGGSRTGVAQPAVPDKSYPEPGPHAMMQRWQGETRWRPFRVAAE